MKRFEIRLEPDLFAAIEHLAQTERRSVNQQIAVLLTQGLLAEEYQRDLPPGRGEAPRWPTELVGDG